MSIQRAVSTIKTLTTPSITGAAESLSSEFVMIKSGTGDTSSLNQPQAHAVFHSCSHLNSMRQKLWRPPNTKKLISLQYFRPVALRRKTAEAAGSSFSHQAVGLVPFRFTVVHVFVAYVWQVFHLSEWISWEGGTQRNYQGFWRNVQVQTHCILHNHLISREIGRENFRLRKIRGKKANVKWD